MHLPRIHPLRVLRVALTVAGLAIGLGDGPQSAEAGLAPSDSRRAIPDSLRGRSGRLKARIEPAAVGPELKVVRDSSTDEPFHFITLLPFAEKRDGRVGVYRVGRWPAEARRPASPAYELPSGFIEVTEENQDVRISTHFRLRDFLGRDQPDVWPKPLVLDPRLVDKLELVLLELRADGIAVEGTSVLSGFRSPRANARGARSSQSPESRHQYGDAADLIVDADGDGRMDDLNEDGHSDVRDVLVILAAVDRVEARFPELVGGIGVYRNTGSSGPFIHIDARGTRVRWGIPPR